MELYSNFIIQFLEEVDNNDELSSENKIKTFFLKANSLYKSDQCDKNCLLLALASEVTIDKSVFSNPISNNFNKYKDYIIKWIENGQEEKMITNNFTSNELANILYDSYHGAILRMKYQLNTNALDEFIDCNLKILNH